MEETITRLVQQARTGDPAAWDHLFQRYELPLYAYAFELLRHEQESLEVVQETFINAARYLTGLRSDEKFASWLFGIAHQKCQQHGRKQNRRRALHADEPVDELADGGRMEADDPGEELLRKEAQAHFFALLEELSAPHRAVLLLHYMEDFSLEQIVEITETPLGTVKSRLHYAKRMLRKLLEEKPL